MHYILLILISLACIGVHAVIFDWFLLYKDNNRFHSIINLWRLDPIEKAYLININDECPVGTSDENITFNYSGKDGLCRCEQDYDIYSNTNKNENQEYYISLCSYLSCDSNFKKVQVVDDIPSYTLNVFFQNKEKQIQFKVCVNRIENYSFAKKAPEKNECNDDEKYCSWDILDKEFNEDYGYCIPKDRQCYKDEIQIKSEIQQYKLKDYLPLIDFEIGNLFYLTNMIEIKQINEEELLQMNYIKYPQDYTKLDVLNEQYSFYNIYMPTVKLRCRRSLKDVLQIYIDPQGIYPIALSAMIFSVIQVILQLSYLRKEDFIEDGHLKCGCFSYCEVKRIGSQYSKRQNVIFILKPLVLFIMLILNLVILKTFVVIYDQFEYMIKDGCLDGQINIYTSFTDTFSRRPFLYDPNLTYASLGLIGVSLLFDSNLFYFFQTIVLFIWKKVRCPNKNKQTQSKIQSTPQVDVMQDGLKNNEYQQINNQQNNKNPEKIIKNKDYYINQQMQANLQFISLQQGDNNSQQINNLKQKDKKMSQEINLQNSPDQLIQFNKKNKDEIIKAPEAPFPPEML